MRPLRSLITVAAAGALAVTPVAFGGVVSQAGASTHARTHVTASRHAHINCAHASAMCTEVANSDEVFGHYVGHDEPSMLFYLEHARLGQPHELQRGAAEGPVGEQPEQGEQVLRLRAQRGRLVRHGHVRHAVVPGAGEDLPAGQRQEHPRPRGLPQARGRGLHGDAVLPARLDSVADLAGGRGRQLVRPDPVVRRAQHRQPVAQPGDRQGEQHDLPEQGGRGVRQLRLHHQERQVARARPTRWTRPPPAPSRPAPPRTCS